MLTQPSFHALLSGSHLARCFQSKVVRLVVLLGAAVVATPRIASADCAPTRPATAEEQKGYADAFALFQRVAPPAPQGWESHDDPKDGVLKDVCAPSGQRVSQWRFLRGYERREGMVARQAEAQRKMTALMQDGQAKMKANEAKLADIRQKMNALTKKVQALMAAKKYEEVDAVNQEMAALEDEQAKLMNVGDQDAAAKAIEAEAKRDAGATFTLSVGETDLDTRAFTPVTVGDIKAVRQLLENDGNPWANLVVVLNPPSAAKSGQNVVRIDADPTRAEALLKAAKLR